MCPSSWTKDGLYSGFHSGKLIDTSVFVDPRALEETAHPGTFPKFWTFRAADLTVGIPHPSGPEARSDSGQRLFEEIAETQTPLRGSDEYINNLVAAPVQIEARAESLRERRANRSSSYRTEEERERRQIYDEVRTFGVRERQIMESAVEVTSIARELDLRWIVVTVDESIMGQ